MNAKQEMLAQIGLYRSMVYVGGRGHGKVAMQHAALEAQRRRAGELLEAQAEGKVYVAPADTPPPLTKQELAERWMEALGIEMAPWQQEFSKGRVFGQWEYTPADELRDRLNNGLQGKDPGLPVNTRYWRDWK